MNLSGPFELVESFQKDGTPNFLSVSGATRGEMESFIQQQILSNPATNIILVVKDHREISSWLEHFDPMLMEKDSCCVFDVGVLPYFAGWGSDRYINPIMVRKQRINALCKLSQNKSPLVTLCTLQGLAQKTLSLDTIHDLVLVFKEGEELDLDALEVKLLELGYVEVKQVDEEATFAFRGGVVDIYPPNLKNPIRIELMGDEIIGIRSFSIASQRTLEKLNLVEIGPSQEAIVTTANRTEMTQRIYDHFIQTDISREDREGWLDAFKLSCSFPGFDMMAPLIRTENESPLGPLIERSIFVFTSPIQDMLDHHKKFMHSLGDAYDKDLAEYRITLAPSTHFASSEELSVFFNRDVKGMEFGSVESSSNQVIFGGNEVKAEIQRMLSAGGTSFSKWAEFIQRLQIDGTQIVVGIRNKDHFEKIKSLFEHREISSQYLKSSPYKLKSGQDVKVRIGIIDFSEVVYDSRLDLLLIPEEFLTGQGRGKKSRRSPKLQNYINSFKDLKVGDLVVHVLHGIARYTGMKALKVGVAESDFLILEYKGGDKIYLPVDKLNLLQKYSSGESGSSGAIDSLKSKNWANRKSKARRAIRDMAEELLKLHAKRKINSGVAFSEPSEEYFSFEGSFPYEETEDQRRVISEVNFDLSSRNPMDRLVCGDVGFGKTEIALRAAFRVAFDNFQTIVLVPTTVLCYQHYRNFKTRFEPFGIRVAQLNRFVSRKEQLEVLRDFSEGRIDILVGTHRVLSKDIKAKKLGMIIIDEEQRFGVAHKEKLKEFKASCEILTLSATPIPRTLHLSMLGLRDISIITTPPVDRLYVKTYVAKFDDLLIKEAVERELARGGQVFYVHNRVEDISQVAAFVTRMVPSARIRTAHGQMPERQLEDVIVDFIEQRFDVLICTTIIESGIDMPNVNTLIVDRSDRFGLSQLYQLRGRVGRSTRQAYAYFLTPSEEQLADEAKKRLEILASHQELGSGFQIASHDMELRGVGNLLGGEQSGKIADVGLELYTEMLEATIREIQGKSEYIERRDVEIKIPVHAIIPRDYIKDEGVRLQLYKSVFSCESEEDLDKLKADTRDRFGAFTTEIERIFMMAHLKILLIKCNVERLVQRPRGDFEVNFYKLAEFQIGALIDVVMKQPKVYRLSPMYQLYLEKIGTTDGLEYPDQETKLVGTLISRLEPLGQAFTDQSASKKDS